jgi:hypothetical protein
MSNQDCLIIPPTEVSVFAKVGRFSGLCCATTKILCVWNYGDSFVMQTFISILLILEVAVKLWQTPNSSRTHIILVRSEVSIKLVFNLLSAFFFALSCEFIIALF